MHSLLALSRLIDGITARIGRSASWIVLIVVLISAGNAVIRKLFNVSSNAFLEIQWYLFSAMFLLAAAYTLQRNEHIRIDLLAGRLSKRGQAVLDIVCTVLFLLPMTSIIAWYGWPIFIDALRSGEMSSDPGGLIRWPILMLIPIGFTLLLLQGVSEIIKRVAFLQGLAPDPSEKTLDPHKEEHV
ncbi:tripartite ATP-independent periplasmic transporter DctQ component [Pseudogulbenkiania sp. NH8B]|uniref:TRAP transporter small permease subunit n=1 Tax=Pseudogulbenkiania sp. (strain NH8B) TaxID=748280 RepID=UPI0002279FF5|nr:TRAP transporter small permease subunit [Pseudogulbenkiania sp. NH8B]BAK77247.1 tripartite ATP-independent periplasmic transporter DctQ component [Pseudogulbenkiania sp. NH8B]